MVNISLLAAKPRAPRIKSGIIQESNAVQALETVHYCVIGKLGETASHVLDQAYYIP